MDVNRDIERILLNLDDVYYKKGMSKLSISIKGIRKDKITKANRKIVISQLLHSKQNTEFINQFLENIKEDLDIFGKNLCVQKILNNPKENSHLIKECKGEVLYLYLLSLHEEKYNEIMDLVLDELFYEKEDEKVGNKNQENQIHELEKYKQENEKYENEMIQLKNISRQRKEKLKEFEIKNNKICEDNIKLEKENIRLKQENEKLYVEITEIKKQLQELTSILDEQKNKSAEKERIVVIDNQREIKEKNCDNIMLLMPDEYIDKEEEIRRQWKAVLVYSKNIHISKLRKIKQLSDNKAKFFETREELTAYLGFMGEKK